MLHKLPKRLDDCSSDRFRLQLNPTPTRANHLDGSALSAPGISATQLNPSNRFLHSCYPSCCTCCWYHFRMFCRLRLYALRDCEGFRVCRVVCTSRISHGTLSTVQSTTQELYSARPARIDTDDHVRVSVAGLACCSYCTGSTRYMDGLPAHHSLPPVPLP